MSQIVNLSDCVPLLNEQVIVLEGMLELHQKSNALLETALNGDFLQQPLVVIHNFLWVLSDVNQETKRLNEDLLEAILQIIKRLTEPSSEPNLGPSGDSIIH